MVSFFKSPGIPEVFKLLLTVTDKNLSKKVIGQLVVKQQLTASTSATGLDEPSQSATSTGNYLLV